VIRLPVSMRAVEAGEKVQRWGGTFDTSYTQPGDYLVGCAGTFFVAAQLPMRIAWCVLTNAAVDLLRPPPPSPGSYGGRVTGQATIVLHGWPVRMEASGARGAGGMPGESRYAAWAVHMPTLPQVPLLGDVVTDASGQSFAVGAAEQDELGWTLLTRQVGG
jgi:hypothetical protein